MGEPPPHMAEADPQELTCLDPTTALARSGFSGGGSELTFDGSRRGVLSVVLVFELDGWDEPDLAV